MAAVTTAMERTKSFLPSSPRQLEVPKDTGFRGCVAVGRKSDNFLYAYDFVTFEADHVYDQGDATGFIRLNALRLRIQALQRNK